MQPHTIRTNNDVISVAYNTDRFNRKELVGTFFWPIACLSFMSSNKRESSLNFGGLGIIANTEMYLLQLLIQNLVRDYRFFLRSGPCPAYINKKKQSLCARGAATNYIPQKKDILRGAQKVEGARNFAPAVLHDRTSS
jgi:hypothetical protein